MRPYLKIRIFILCMCVAGMATSLSAQTARLQLKTTSGKIVEYGQTGTVTTVDSTVTTAEIVQIANNSAGIITVAVVGVDSLGNGVTGEIKYRYHKAAGTLTLASGTDQSAIVTDTGLGTSTFTVTSVSNNVYIKVKGKTGATATHWTVNWRWRVQQFRP